MPPDIAAAAGRLAAHARYATGDMRPVQSADLVALLPVLEAMAAGQDEAGRVERMNRYAKALFGDARYAPGTASDREQERIIEVAIALADAERAAWISSKAPEGTDLSDKDTELWSAYEEARERYGLKMTSSDPRKTTRRREIERDDARAALDALVRRLMP